MRVADVAGTLSINTTFLDFPVPTIPRTHLLDSIEDIFTEGFDTVLVDGPQGAGKSTLLALFAARHPLHTFSLFIRPSSRWARDPEILELELANQIHWVLQGTQLEPGAASPTYRDLLYQLQRQIRKSRNTYYFVVDGLDDIPDAEDHTSLAILELLPFGYQSCRFLLAAVGTPHAFISGPPSRSRSSGLQTSHTMSSPATSKIHPSIRQT